MAGKRKTKKKSRSRRISFAIGFALLLLFALHLVVSVWFVHHPYEWIRQERASMPAFLFNALYGTGNFTGDITDACDLTGHDAVYENDDDPPAGAVTFAGDPTRTGDPAPQDITVLDRGHFRIGWSPSLGHPVWCAYHVTRDSSFPFDVNRPDFARDNAVRGSPAPGAYRGSRYDRGHMAPNYAIATRYGRQAQVKTFLMSNIVPQAPALNRGAWRDLEHRIAELWTARYGEIWAIVGNYSAPDRAPQTLPGAPVDIPDNHYMIVVAQEGRDLRVLAVDLSQHVAWNEYPARHIVTVDELERKTGLDFLADLPDFIEEPIEAERPSRLWPVRFRDILRMIAIHMNRH